MENREIGSNMSTRDIEGEWRAASYFLAKGPSASLQYLQQDVRSQLFALKAQVLDGDCPPGQDGSMAMDPSLRIRQEAWNALGGMSGEDGKRRYVDLLSKILPDGRIGVQITHQSEAVGMSMRVRPIGHNSVQSETSSTSTEFSRL